MVNIYQGKLPEDSLLKDVPNHYIDSYYGSFAVYQERTIEEAIRLFFTSSPKWVDSLFRLRNKIVKIVGLKASNIDPSKISEFPINIGQSFGLFKILEKNDKEAILGEDDRHLDFRVSIYLVKTGNKQQLTISTIALFHNSFGKMYFYLIKPFHKMVVRAMLSQMTR